MWVIIGAIVSLILNMLFYPLEVKAITLYGCYRINKKTCCKCGGNPKECCQECMLIALEDEDEEVQEYIDAIATWHQIANKVTAVLITAICMGVCFLIMR